jgi:16S rRNA (guanine966-N2)-methyltransferase
MPRLYQPFKLRAVRIISGKNRGRKIIAPTNLPVRPTTDFAKEALFNILLNHTNLEGIDVLDLFAGTGNISYEFISRNAQKVTAVDSNFKCTKFIQQTAYKLNYPNLTVILSDYKAFLKHASNKYNIIFADPPYEMEEVDKLPELIFAKELLKPEGMLILEHKKTIDFSRLPFFLNHKVYGNVNFSFFRADK